MKKLLLLEMKDGWWLLTAMVVVGAGLALLVFGIRLISDGRFDLLPLAIAIICIHSAGRRWQQLKEAQKAKPHYYGFLRKDKTIHQTESGISYCMKFDSLEMSANPSRLHLYAWKYFDPADGYVKVHLVVHDPEEDKYVDFDPANPDHQSLYGNLSALMSGHARHCPEARLGLSTKLH